MKKYYALYDTQLDGYKAGYISETKEEMMEMGAERVRELADSDEESPEEAATDQELMDEYGYEVREVSENDSIKIMESNKHGLLTVVHL